jgi:regulator of replication initiation timing
MISKVFKYFIHLVMPNRVERIELLNDKITVLNRAIQETKRQINNIIDEDFNIDVFNNLGRRLANLKTELNSVIRERDDYEYTYSPPRPRKTAGDMRRFLRDGEEVKCRDYIGIYRLNENIIEYNGTKFRSLSNFAANFYSSTPNGWEVVKKKRGNNWISIDSPQGTL